MRTWQQHLVDASAATGYLTIVAAFSMAVLREMGIAIFLLITGAFLELPQILFTVHQLTSNALSGVIYRFLGAFRGRILRTILLYFSLFLYLEYFWYTRLSTQPSWLEGELWAMRNVNVEWNIFAFIVPLGGFLLITGLIVIPMLVWYAYQDIKEKRYGSFVSTCVSVPSFLLYFLSGSQLAFQVWTATTLVSILGWPRIKRSGTRNVFNALREVALTSICVLIISLPFSIMLPNPIHDPNYLTLSEQYNTVVNTWYTTDIHLRDLRSYAWQTNWWRGSDLATNSYSGAIRSFDSLSISLLGSRSVLSSIQSSTLPSNFISSILAEVVWRGAELDELFLQYAEVEGTFYVSYALIFGSIDSNNSTIWLGRMAESMTSARLLVGEMDQKVSEIPDYYRIFYYFMIHFHDEFTQRLQYLNQSYSEALNTTQRDGPSLQSPGKSLLLSHQPSPTSSVALKDGSGCNPALLDWIEPRISSAELGTRDANIILNIPVNHRN